MRVLQVNTIDDMMSFPVMNAGTILYVREVDTLFIHTFDGGWQQINRPRWLQEGCWEFPGEQKFTIWEETLEESITIYA